MTFTAERKNESLSFFLYREKLYSDRSLAVSDIKKGCISVNGKVKKDPDYIVKKNDKFSIKGTPAAGCLVTFIVEE